MVYDLAALHQRRPTRRAGPIPRARRHPPSTITKPPSAELRPDQKDSDSLPAYDVLDQIIDRYVEQEQSAQRIVDRPARREMVMKFVRS